MRKSPSLWMLSAFTLFVLLLGGQAVWAAAPPSTWNEEADVVVVGYGGAGARAAVEAHDLGADVLILEKMPVAGGNTAMCGGAIYGAGTSVQKAAGVNDSPAAMKKYYNIIRPGLNLPEFTEMVADGSASAVDWVIKNGAEIPAKFGLPGITIGGFERLHEDVTPAVERSHWAVGGGAGLFKPFYNAVKSRNIKVRFSTPVQRLCVDPSTGDVVGVRATRNGKDWFVKARKAVVLATGGFSQNPEMLTAFIPNGNMFAGAKGAKGVTGDGIKMAQEVGAQLWAMSDIIISMGIQGSPGTYFTPFMEYTVVVNQAGKRYISEGAWTQPISEETLKQPGGIGFLVFDSELRKRSEVDVTLNSVVPAKSVIKADTLEELAQKLGIDPAGLKDTIAKYNSYCASGNDPLGKTKAELIPVATAPFYGIKSWPLPVLNTGGILTDTKARVLNSFDEPINRLYAAGEVTGGKLVGYPGCGTSVAAAVIFGEIAGANAAKEASL